MYYMHFSVNLVLGFIDSYTSSRFPSSTWHIQAHRTKTLHGLNLTFYFFWDAKSVWLIIAVKSYLITTVLLYQGNCFLFSRYSVHPMDCPHFQCCSMNGLMRAVRMIAVEFVAVVVCLLLLTLPSPNRNPLLLKHSVWIARGNYRFVLQMNSVYQPYWINNFSKIIFMHMILGIL